MDKNNRRPSGARWMNSEENSGEAAVILRKIISRITAAHIQAMLQIPTGGKILGR